MLAALYIRVSTDEQASSAAAQEEGARGWCAREGHRVVAVYRDEGVSGGEWVRRAGVLQLRADVAATPRPWDVLVVRDLDRLGRDAIRLPALLSHLADHDARVVEWSTGQTVALDGMALIVAQLRAGLAQIEREQIAHRTRTALAQRAAKGLVTGGVVYGYTNRRSAEGVVYEVHEGEAEVVREIFKRTAAGESARRIAVALNTLSVPSPRAEGGGTGAWCPGTVRAIVRNARYRGDATWGELGSRYRGGTRTVVRRDDAIHYAVPVIIEDELWHRAQLTGGTAARVDCATPTGLEPVVTDVRGWRCPNRLDDGARTGRDTGSTESRQSSGTRIRT
jgi:DNA invertase Pin-like site-specific DNA recombinase